MVKRSPQSSPEPETETEPKSESPQTPTKRPKTKTKPKSTPATPTSSPAKRGLTDREKTFLLIATMDLASRNLPFADLSRELNLPESRLKYQFKANRANLRKAIEELYKSGG